MPQDRLASAPLEERPTDEQLAADEELYAALRAAGASPEDAQSCLQGSPAPHVS